MKFELNKKEIEAKEKFYKACKELLGDKDSRLYYTFTPTGIGSTVVIGSAELKIEKDITDYDSW